nr:helix-turn-helix domain-containing protein [Chromobacterium sp. ASV5]
MAKCYDEAMFTHRTPPTMTTHKDANQIICDNIRRHLEQFRWPEQQQASLLEQILGLSTSQAYRKLNGSSAWQLQQVEQLAQYFNVSAASLLVDHEARKENLPCEAELIPAILHLNDLSGEAHCWVQLGESLADDSCAPLFMAMRIRDCWHVYPGTLHDLEGGFEVSYLTIRPPKRANSKRLLVGVLDDTDADLLSAILVQHGLFALPYQRPEQLLEALPREHFDAFVLDWVLGGDQNGMAMIEAIRRRTAHTPIIVLTGYAQQHEQALQQALQTHGVYYVGKPTPGSILALQIKNVVTSAVEASAAAEA